MTTRNEALDILTKSGEFGRMMRSFSPHGNGRERGDFRNWPPRSMDEGEKQYYAKHKHLDYARHP